MLGRSHLPLVLQLRIPIGAPAVGCQVQDRPQRSNVWRITGILAGVGHQHAPRPALIAITGYGGSVNADRALAAGFDYDVVKPVDGDVLLRLIDSSMRVEDWSTSGFGVITSHGSLQEDDRRDLRN